MIKYNKLHILFLFYSLWWGSTSYSMLDLGVYPLIPTFQVTPFSYNFAIFVFHSLVPHLYGCVELRWFAVWCHLRYLGWPVLHVTQQKSCVPFSADCTPIERVYKKIVFVGNQCQLMTTVHFPPFNSRPSAFHWLHCLPNFFLAFSFAAPIPQFFSHYSFIFLTLSMVLLLSLPTSHIILLLLLLPSPSLPTFPHSPISPPPPPPPHPTPLPTDWFRSPKFPELIRFWSSLTPKVVANRENDFLENSNICWIRDKSIIYSKEAQCLGKFICTRKWRNIIINHSPAACY